LCDENFKNCVVRRRSPRLSLLKSVGQEGATREWIVEPEIDAQQVDEMVNEHPVVIPRMAAGNFTERKDKMRKIELKNEERVAEVAVVEQRESMNKLAADRFW
jgi:hypothetical protein